MPWNVLSHGKTIYPVHRLFFLLAKIKLFNLTHVEWDGTAGLLPPQVPCSCHQVGGALSEEAINWIFFLFVISKALINIVREVYVTHTHKFSLTRRK
jgi:hypothetical protein